MEHSNKYRFLMSQLRVIDTLKENDKTKICMVYHEGMKTSCILRVCKNRDLSVVCTALRKVRNPNIVVVLDYVYENGNTYILEENVSGQTIEEIIETEECFSEQRTARVIIEVCKALEKLHQLTPPVVHNDINPSNIKIRDDGSVKLFDFDISRTYKKGQAQNTVLFGTEEYAAPEHFGYGQSEPRTDIYSLGVTMHKMLTGKGLSTDHKITYNGQLKKIIQKCLEVDPQNRYTSARALRKDLEKASSIRKTFAKKTMVALLCFIFLAAIVTCFLFKESSTNDSDYQGTPGMNALHGVNESSELYSAEENVSEDSRNETDEVSTLVTPSAPVDAPSDIEVNKTFVSTLSSLPQNADELVFTKSGVIYYLKDNKLFSIKNGTTVQIFDGDTEYYEEVTEPDMVSRLKENLAYWRGLDDNAFINQNGMLYFDRVILSNLGYNQATDTVYVSGSTNMDSLCGMRTYNHLIFSVSDMEKPIWRFSYGTLDGTVGNDDIVEPQIIYTNKTIVYHNGDQVVEIDPVFGTTVKYPVSFYDTHPAFSFNRKYLYVNGIRFEFGYGANKYDVSQNTWVPLSLTDDGINMATAFCINNDQIYYTTHSGISCLEPSGTNRFKSVDVIQWDNLKIEDGAPIGEISQFLFDDNGDVIFSDDTQHKLRKICIFE